MNDVTLTELKIVVEQAVRPVRATMARKRKMREELLAHLLAIFEEEAEKLGDEQTALEQAKQRFGDPRELTGQLQQTVPQWDRFARLFEAYDFPRLGEPLLRFAGRLTIFTLVAFAAMISIVLPALLLHGREGECAMELYVLLIIGILTIPFMLAFALLTDGMYRALYRGQSGRSWRLAMMYGLISLLVFPVFAFLWYWSLTGDLAMSLRHVCFACCIAPLAPLLFAIMARKTAELRRHYEEWASIEINE
ncbi:MAG: hypothetical protein ACLP9L_18495 [Thermoguttaceae bacterium]